MDKERVKGSPSQGVDNTCERHFIVTARQELKQNRTLKACTVAQQYKTLMEWNIWGVYGNTEIGFCNWDVQFL